MKALYRKIGNMGPGGFKCHCCGPKPGKDRRRFRKWVRHKLKIMLQTEQTKGSEG